MSGRDWIQGLDADSFLAVYDVLIDIQKELNLAKQGAPVDIPVMPQIIKFRQLFPGDSVGMRDNYCNMRWKAVRFLADKGIVHEPDIEQGGHRWESRIVIISDRAAVSDTLAGMAADYERRTAKAAEAEGQGVTRGNKVFIGHGRSRSWTELRDFLRDRLKLDWVEFNREPIAGISTKERLEEMLSQSVFAFLVMTAEDEHNDGSRHARENVIHEAGLFQGKLGFKRAIILLEEGCTEFANIQGLGQIRFPSNNVQAAFEEIRRVLEREKLI